MAKQFAHVVAVDMGYGHERAAYALRELARGEVVIANNYEGIPDRDRSVWEQGRSYYETISRMQPVPFVGKAIFEVFLDKFQEIEPFYPRRDLSAPSIQLRQMHHSIAHRGWGRDLIQRLTASSNGRLLPLVTTFFMPAFAAEEFGYPGDIYVVICDADIARVWAPWNPRKSRIRYFAPNGRVVERLQCYGVRRDHIFLTGFPLPKELVGGVRSERVQHDLSIRIANLDPNGYFRQQHRALLRTHFGRHARHTPNRPVTVSFAVGGAGAQKRTGFELLAALRHQVRRGQIRLQLIAGTRKSVAQDFLEQIKLRRLSGALAKGNVRVLMEADRWQYFSSFSSWMRETDILWTKPSELSFYSGLGIPIIMSDPIGSQEDFNHEWLRQVGSGIDQLDVSHAGEWLWDWIQSGAFARMAWNGYIEAPTHGTYRIESIVKGRGGVELAPHAMVV